MPDVRVVDPVGAALLRARDAFVSTEIYGTFGRYALSQEKRLADAARLAEHRALLLEWLLRDPALSLDAAAARLAERTAAAVTPDALLRARQYIKQPYHAMHDQGLLPAADFAALARFTRERATECSMPRELRPKSAYNLLRLVAAAVHWLRTEQPLIRVEGALRDRLLAIKRGEVGLETALRWTEEMAEALEEARAHSVLPPRPDVARADALLRAAREEAARRWVGRAPGPWGDHMAPAPVAEALEREP